MSSCLGVLKEPLRKFKRLNINLQDQGLHALELIEAVGVSMVDE